jgi:hypothetical protein
LNAFKQSQLNQAKNQQKLEKVNQDWHRMGGQRKIDHLQHIHECPWLQVIVGAGPPWFRNVHDVLRSHADKKRPEAALSSVMLPFQISDSPLHLCIRLMMYGIPCQNVALKSQIFSFSFSCRLHILCCEIYTFCI